MKDITPRMLHYREAARHLWNVYLFEEDTLQGGALSNDPAVPQA